MPENLDLFGTFASVSCNVRFDNLRKTGLVSIGYYSETPSSFYYVSSNLRSIYVKIRIFDELTILPIFFSSIAATNLWMIVITDDRKYIWVENMSFL